ncbi:MULTISPECIES: AprI/Inh family metalloprotease inhibitor [unclassified Afipia]|uniref:AprI/Inh family metalloprotease inhibitor n=1 Tax=unclassified Afipia TaxID=2642050 RepID=UPI00042346E8|nr:MULTISPECIES: AprI/Inh family metalloprotease inhibitor [unclassified Afipia]
MLRAALSGLTKRLLIGRVCLLALAGVLMIVPDAVAQDARSLTKEMVGEWELSTAGRDKTCIVTLKSDSTPQGLKLELDKGCSAALPFTKSIVAWSVKGLDIVRLQDAAGQSVIDVTEVESGIFEGLRQGEGVYLLQNLAAARALSKSADQLIGDWAMVRGSGKAICGLTLTNTEATTPENFAVYLKPRCDPLVTAFAPIIWRIERGELLLQSAKGEIWRFEADDNAQWRRIPDSADPLLLTRQ